MIIKKNLPGQSIIQYIIDYTLADGDALSGGESSSPTRGAYSELRVVQALHSDDYNATRVQYITLISHTGAQRYHN